jgi:phosphoglycerate dehydrogenase-like enzyme
MQVAFAGSPDSPIFPILAKELEGFQFSAIPPQELTNAKNLDVIIALRGRWGREEMIDLPVSLIQRFGAGVDTVDLDAMNQLGIWVANVPSLPSKNADSVADLALFLVLGVSRKARELGRSIESGHWNYSPGTLLKGKAACLVGMGGLGLSIAERLQAFGMKLIGVRKHPQTLVPDELHFDKVYGSENLLEALSKAYCVVVCASSDSSTHRLMGEAQFRSMPRGAILINVARGALVDEEALFNSLESGHLGGAGLDVFVQEPLSPESPLHGHPLVFATPHCGGDTHEATAGIASYIGNNLRQYAAGKRLGSLVNEPFHPRVKLF